MKNRLAALGEKIKKSFSSQRVDDPSEVEEEYVELDTSMKEELGSKIIIKPFTIEDFADVKPILDSLRAGNIVSLINIRPLKDKDLVELKRSINKIKKTCDALDGDIAGFSDDWIVAVPSFAQISRGKSVEAVEEQPEQQ